MLLTMQTPCVKSEESSAWPLLPAAPQPRTGEHHMANPNRLTTQQVVDLVKELTGKEIKPMTFAGYVTRGQAPKPVEKIGATPLWKRSEIVEWAENRPGRGARTDLRKPRRPAKPTGAE